MNKIFITKLAAATGLLLLSSVSWAGCTLTGGTEYQSKTLPKQTLTLPRDKATGPVGTVMTIDRSTGRNISCSGGPTYTHLKFGTNLTPSDIPGVYKTNVEGIGIKVWDNAIGGTVIVDNDIKRWYSPSSSSTYSGLAWLVGINVQYYIIGPVTTGTVIPNIVVEAWANTATTTAGGARYASLTMSGSSVVNILACETPDIKVNLNKQDGDALRSIDATTPATPFNFSINKCGAGLGTVSYTFKPGPGISLNGSGTSQHLTLDSGSTGSGVGVQMLYDGGANDGKLVPFNTKTRFTGYTGTGSYTIPMKARYIRTGHIVGGTANSAVEFSMLYE